MAASAGEAGEPLGCDAHQLWGRGDIPIGVGNFGVSNISRDGVHHMIDLIVLLASQQGIADKGVAQVVDARLRMAAAGNPAQVPTEMVEGAVNGSLGSPSRFTSWLRSSASV